ncbi:smalltalk protein [Bacteroides sp.]|nr:smalltalk protein [Bacteroides sp.]
MKESNKKLWGTILKLIIALATAVAGAFGLGACMG